jgi:hypothetical protein
MRDVLSDTGRKTAFLETGQPDAVLHAQQIHQWGSKHAPALFLTPVVEYRKLKTP